MRKYVDSHCHLGTLCKLLGREMSAVVEAAGEGFDGCVSVPTLPGEGVEFRHPKVKYAVGIHPLRARDLTLEVEKRLREYARMPHVCAIGEIGMDKYKGAHEVDLQRRAFVRQVEIAVESGLPICIHTRRADEETLEVLKMHVPRDHKVHVHCFSDSLEFCAAVLGNWRNAFFGVTGKILYRESEHIKEICRLVPLDRLLAETDAPYLRPPEWKEKYSSPSLIPLIITEIAKTKRVDEEATFAQTQEHGVSLRSLKILNVLLNFLLLFEKTRVSHGRCALLKCLCDLSDSMLLIYV